jgi:tRNA-modifying protein YgfZ
LDAFHADLDREKLLLLSGPDSLKFLQGQTTCDTDLLTGSSSLLGAYCNPQGRVVCDFLLTQLAQEQFALRMRRDIVPQAATTLGKYIIFSKAELSSEDSDWQVMACWGPDVKQVLSGIFPVLPDARLGATTDEGYALVQIDEAGCQFECFYNSAIQPGLREKLAASMASRDASSWQVLQINSGIGRVEEPTVEAFIPQMLNFDITGHISFTKGCYTGQEVVARMHYRGKPKRRLYLASLAEGNPPTPGSALFRSGSEQSVGNIVNSAQQADNQTVALVVATADGIENGLHVGAVDGPVLTVGELPYPMEKPSG